MKLSLVNKAAWKKMKLAADLPPKSGLRKNDISVGKTIDAFQKARAKYKSNKTKANITKYSGELGKLYIQFDRFCKAREFKTDLAEGLQRTITKWKNEIKKKRVKLQTVLKAMNGVDEFADEAAEFEEFVS